MKKDKPTNYHPVVDQIKNLLDKGSYWYELFEHTPVRTSEEAHAIRTSYTLSQGTKALVIKLPTRNPSTAAMSTPEVDNGEIEAFPDGRGQDYRYRFVLLVVPGDKRFDRGKVRNLFRTKKFRFATVEEVAKLSEGVKPGGIPPFGHLFDLEVYADKSIFGNNKIIFNAGDPRISIGMKAEDYKALANPIIVEIV